MELKKKYIKFYWESFLIVFLIIKVSKYLYILL